jgi:hypothetical protein
MTRRQRVQLVIDERYEPIQRVLASIPAIRAGGDWRWPRNARGRRAANLVAPPIAPAPPER